MGCANHFKIHIESLREVSQRWDWNRRLIAWERVQSELALLAFREKAIEANQRHIELGQLMQKRGRDAMLLKKNPEQLSESQAHNLIVSGVRLERDGYGLFRQTEQRLEPGSETAQEPDQVTGFVFVEETITAKARAGAHTS